jgi:hypothetical protein
MEAGGRATSAVRTRCVWVRGGGGGGGGGGIIMLFECTLTSLAAKMQQH